MDGRSPRSLSRREVSTAPRINTTYSLGVYKVDVNSVEVRTTVYVIGESRTIFGRKQRRYDLDFNGKIEAKSITGEAGDRECSVRFRATWIGGLS